MLCIADWSQYEGSFKSIFTNLNANLQDEGTANWIFNIEITALNNSVENENETHITILH